MRQHTTLLGSGRGSGSRRGSTHESHQQQRTAVRTSHRRQRRRTDRDRPRPGGHAGHPRLRHRTARPHRGRAPVAAEPAPVHRRAGRHVDDGGEPPADVPVGRLHRQRGPRLHLHRPQPGGDARSGADRSGDRDAAHLDRAARPAGRVVQPRGHLLAGVRGALPQRRPAGRPERRRVDLALARARGGPPGVHRPRAGRELGAARLLLRVPAARRARGVRRRRARRRLRPAHRRRRQSEEPRRGDRRGHRRPDRALARTREDPAQQVHRRLPRRHTRGGLDRVDEHHPQTVSSASRTSATRSTTRRSPPPTSPTGSSCSATLPPVC